MFKAPRTYVPSNLRCVTLPVSDKPQEWDAEGYELDDNKQRKKLVTRGTDGKEVVEDPKALLSVEESLVLLQSLQQTRQHHVQELFPIFTTSQGPRVKAKAKQVEEENSIPKHDIKLIGKCGLTVGPLSFQDVSLWECRFLEYQHPVPPKAKTPPPQPAPQPVPQAGSPTKRPGVLTPSLVEDISKQQVKHPWLHRLIQQAAQKTASHQDLLKLGYVIDHITAGVPLPPALPNGDAPQVPPLPRKPAPPVKQQPTRSRTPPPGSCWRYSKDKAPLLLVSFEENPSTKFAIPVQLSFISYSNSKAPPMEDSPGVTDNMLSHSEDDTITVEMFLPCRGWGKWENAPDLSRHYRTISTRRKQGNVYPNSVSRHSMMRPLPVDAKNDFGPIGGISIPAGLLEPVSVSLTDLGPEACLQVRKLAREIENFDRQGEADVTLSAGSGVADRAVPSSAMPLSMNGSHGSTVQSMQGIQSTQPQSGNAYPSGAAVQTGNSRDSENLDDISQSPRKRPRRSETRGLNGEKSRSTSPASGMADRPVGGKPWKVQLFERLLERVPKRAFLKCRLPPPVQPEIVDAAVLNNPARPTLIDMTQKMPSGKKAATLQSDTRPSNNTTNSSRKRKAHDNATTDNSETTVTLESLESAIVKTASTPLVLDDTLKQPRRSIKPAFDSSVPCQGCGAVGLKIWRKGPNGKATLCSTCGDKFAQGTLGPLGAPNAGPAKSTHVNPSGKTLVRYESHPQSTKRQPNESTSNGLSATPSSHVSSTVPRGPFPPTASVQSGIIPSVLQPASSYVAGPRPEAGWSGQQLPSSARPHPAPQPRGPSTLSSTPSGNTFASPTVQQNYRAGLAGQARAPLGGPSPSHGFVGARTHPNPTKLQVGHFPSSAGSSSARSGMPNSPAGRYHEPVPEQGYIPPRRILPTTICNPLIEATEKSSQLVAPLPVPGPRQLPQIVNTSAPMHAVGGPTVNGNPGNATIPLGPRNPRSEAFVTSSTALGAVAEPTRVTANAAGIDLNPDRRPPGPVSSGNGSSASLNDVEQHNHVPQQVTGAEAERTTVSIEPADPTSVLANATHGRT